MKRLASVLVLGLLAAGCGSQPVAAETARESAAPEAREPAAVAVPPAAEARPAAPESKSPPSEPAESEDQVLERLTGEALKSIETIRGLKMKHPVERRWTSRDQMKADMLKQMDEEMPPEKMAAFSRLLAFLGLVKEGTDLKETFSDAMAGAVAGYYLPDEKVFFLVRGMADDGSRPIVFHELTHAVEDQYYDYFDQMEKWSKADNGDRAMAVRGVVEGSAQLYTEKFMASEPGLEDRFFQATLKEQMSDGGKAVKAQMETPPFFMILMAMYPYHNGSRFLRAVQAKLPAPEEGEDPMARFYNDPPASTEMVLHPEKYLGDRDLPQEVRLPALAAALGEGWKEEIQDTAGELTTGVLLNAWFFPNNLIGQLGSVALFPEGGIKKAADQLKIGVAFRGKTGTAAAGWDGDRQAMYGRGEDVCMAWASVWDSDQDAREFADAYGEVVGKKYRTEVAPEKEGDKPKKVPAASEPFEREGWAGSLWKTTRDGFSTFVVAKGNRVLVAERFPSDRLDAVFTELAKTEFTRDEKDALPAAAK